MTKQADPLVSRLIELCQINSHTFNPAGVRRVAEKAMAALRQMGGEVSQESVPPVEVIGRDGTVLHRELGPAVVARFPALGGSTDRVLLSIHLDTVFPADSPFQTARHDGDHLIGPGVVDAKGGLLVLLEGLRRARKGRLAGDCPAVTVILNPDEEIGSPSSRHLLRREAASCRWALVFEPTLPDGAMVSQRMGSGTYTLVVRGRSAHSGRDFSRGRSALLGAARIALRLDELNRQREGVVVNPGVLESGTAVNIVPEVAVLRVNVRVATVPDGAWLEERVREIAADPGDGLRAEVHGGLLSPPRVLDAGGQALLTCVREEAARLDLPTDARPSGGTCDGNKLASYGLAVADSMGPTGGELHSDREYVVIESLSSRAELLSRVLRRLAAMGPAAA